MDWPSCCRDQSAHIKDHCTWVGGSVGGGSPHKGALPAWLILGPGDSEHGKGERNTPKPEGRALRMGGRGVQHCHLVTTTGPL